MEDTKHVVNVEYPVDSDRPQDPQVSGEQITVRKARTIKQAIKAAVKVMRGNDKVNSMTITVRQVK